MRWPWSQAPLPQQNTAPPKTEIEIRIEKLERSLRNFEADRDDWLNKYKTLQARISRQLERAERRAEAQDAPEPTNAPQGGVTPPPDKWTVLARHKEERRATG